MIKRLWRYSKLAVLFIWLCTIIFLAFWIAYRNDDPVILNLLLLDIEQDVGVVFILVFASGLLIGALPFLFFYLLDRNRHRSLNKKVTQLELELKNTRSAALGK